jgi:hypothetical protein
MSTRWHHADMAAKRRAPVDDDEDVTQMAFRIGQQATGQASDGKESRQEPVKKVTGAKRPTPRRRHKR